MLKKLFLAGCGGTIAAFTIAGCAAACLFICGGLGREVGKSIEQTANQMQKEIDRTYGENDNLWTQADVKRVSKAAVEACLKHPNDATILIAKASRFESKDILGGKIAWTCRGSLNAPLEGMPLESWLVSLVLVNKAEKKWKVGNVMIGDREFLPTDGNPFGPPKGLIDK